jgi:hypothetical protein
VLVAALAFSTLKSIPTKRLISMANTSMKEMIDFFLNFLPIHIPIPQFKIFLM